MIININIKLEVPKDFEGMGVWSKKATLADYISHWLTEGYYTNDGFVDLPEGIKLKDYEIDFPKSWTDEKTNNN